MRGGAAQSLITISPPPGSPFADYRRRARRLRHRLRHDPARLHRSLRQLARLQGAENPGASPQPTGPASQFAQLVHDAFEGDVLRYSRRAKLLKAAKSMGIDDFEAHLLIALVQHHRPVSESQSELSTTRRSWPLILLAVLAVQGAIILAAGWALSA